jgi:hypothetical protein
MHLAAAKFAYSTLLVYTTAYSSAYDALTLLLTRRSGRKYLFRSALLTVGRTLFRLVFFFAISTCSLSRRYRLRIGARPSSLREQSPARHLGACHGAVTHIGSNESLTVHFSARAAMQGEGTPCRGD